MALIFRIVSVIIIFSCQFNVVISQYYGGENGKKLDWAVHYLEKYYVDSTNVNAITDAAIKAMAAELDPFSVYQTAEELRKQKQADDGVSAIGIGVNLIIIDFYPYVTAVLKGGAAEESGLLKGDIIKKINGEDTYRLPLDSIVEKLKGELNTVANVEINRAEKSILKKIERKKIPLKSIEASFILDDSIGYVKIGRFTLKTISEFKAAIASLKKQGLDDLIIDLRQNNGGVFDAAVDLAAEFLPANSLIVYTSGNIVERKDYRTDSDGSLVDNKVVLLIDGVTASASEIFACALQDWDRAILIGTPSYGKGLIQQSYGFSDSSAIRLTIGKYYTPSGRAIQKDHNEILVLPPHIYQGSETAKFIEHEQSDSTMSGRYIYSLGAGIVPDVMWKNDPIKPSFIPYKFIAEHFFENRESLTSRLLSVEQLYNDVEIDRLLLNKDPYILERTKIRYKAWLGALQFGEEAYFKLMLKKDDQLKEALKRIKDNSFDRIGIRY